MKKKISLSLIIILLGMCISLYGYEYFVDPEFTEPWRPWVGEFPNIQAALDSTEAHQLDSVHIYVSSDTYNENIAIPSGLLIILEGDSTKISGDQTGQAVVTIENPHLGFQMFGFIIECNNLNRGFYIANYNVDPEYNVAVNENRESEWEPTHENDEIFHELLYDIDIYDGYKVGNGAGILITNSCYFKFLNINISNCSAGIMSQNYYDGGGICFEQCYNMKTELINIHDCSASQAGGGMCFVDCYQYEDNSFIEGFNISNCQAGEYGGGISIIESSQIRLAGTWYPYPEESSCIDSCTAINGAGIAIYAYSQNYNDLILFNVMVYENSATNNGGGIYRTESLEGSWLVLYFSEIFSNNSCNGAGICLDCPNNTLSILFGSEIYNNSAENFGGGIYSISSTISNLYPTPSSCSVYNNEASEGGGIFCDNGIIRFDGRKCTTISTPPYYVYDEDSYTIEIYGNSASERGGGIMAINSDGYIWNTIISENTANDGAGIYYDNGELELKKLYIFDNVATRFGGGLYCDESFPDIDDPIIICGNGAQDGAGICCEGTISNVKNVVVLTNSAGQYGGGIYCMENSNVTISNITTADNTSSDGSGIYADGNIDITNSIIRDDMQEGIGTITATYCDIMNGWSGNGNIDVDPCFTDISNLDYALLQASPCIDAGDPNSDLDPDGTCTDMGPFTATPETYVFSSGEINWSSFPILNPNNIDAYDFFEPLILNGTLKEVRHTNTEKLYYYSNQNIWINDIGDLRTVDGYKVEMYEPDSLPLYGYKVESDTTISLYAEIDKGPWPPPLGDENWIGYFIPGSQLWQMAFSQILDKITFIKADDWAYIPNYTVNLPYTVDYGKSYVVGVSEDCSFTWQGITQAPVETYTKQETKVFTYEETFDYMPIFVDSIKAFTGIDEIGIFLEDECIGASVIEGFPVFISAYVDDDSMLTKGSNELTFQVASYGKGGKSSISALLYDEAQNAYVEKPVVLDNKSYALVRLETGEDIEFPVEFTVYQNYPNPVRSTTTISFTLPEDYQEAEVKIYNIKGQLVKELVSSASDLGFNAVWDCTDDHNKPVSNGIYFYKVTSGVYSELKKMIIMR